MKYLKLKFSELNFYFTYKTLTAVKKKLNIPFFNYFIIPKHYKNR